MTAFLRNYENISNILSEWTDSRPTSDRGGPQEVPRDQRLRQMQSRQGRRLCSPPSDLIPFFLSSNPQYCNIFFDFKVELTNT